jgi:AraC family transcriptional regulator, transcriptional activator FtrA
MVKPSVVLDSFRYYHVMKKHLVVALAYDGLCTFEMGCVIEIFALPRPEIVLPWYEFQICAAKKGWLRATGGLGVRVPYSLEALDRAETIIVPGWNLEIVPSRVLIQKLQAAAKRGARICSICSGVFLLAAAGLLSEKRVTTHWKYSQRLAELYPDLDVQTNLLYVQSGQIVTSAGSAAGLDMMLFLIRADFGAKIANLVAQRLVIAPQRHGDQAQFMPRPVLPDEHGHFSKLLEWVRSRPTTKHTLASLARRALMSPRTLQRHFQDALGMTPMQWLTFERVLLARDLLEQSRQPISRIAEKSGFGSEEAFRKHFRVLVGVSPRHYRNQFGRSSSKK